MCVCVLSEYELERFFVPGVCVRGVCVRGVCVRGVCV